MHLHWKLQGQTEITFTFSGGKLPIPNVIQFEDSRCLECNSMSLGRWLRTF